MSEDRNAATRISDAEWEVMRVVWERRTATAQEIVAALAHRAWNARTIKTMLNRLLGKGALVAESRGRAYVYRAAVPKEHCVRQESQSFLERVFGGASGPLLLHFARRSRLSRVEIEELKAILDRKKS